MHDYQLTPAEIALLQEKLRRDSAELDTIFHPDAAEKKMLAEAKAFVINSKSCVTARELIAIAGSSGIDIGSQLGEWEREQRIFAFNYEGVDYFPLYAFNPQRKFEPHAAMAEILAIFGKEMSGWECAFWFEGVNGFLSGKAPKNLIVIDPEIVTKAALLEMQPIMHA